MCGDGLDSRSRLAVDCEQAGRRSRGRQGGAFIVVKEKLALLTGAAGLAILNIADPPSRGIQQWQNAAGALGGARRIVGKYTYVVNGSVCRLGASSGAVILSHRVAMSTLHVCVLCVGGGLLGMCD